MDNGITDNVTAALVAANSDFFQYKQYKKGEYILKEGQRVTDIYFITSGLVKLSSWDDQAKECILSFAYENWWETDFSAFYRHEPSLLRLQCLEDTKLYSIGYEHYQTLLKEDYLAQYFLDKSIKGHIASQRRILSLLTSTAKQRYEHFVQEYPALVQRIPKSTLALYLGVSRETLSRLYNGELK